MAWGVGLRGEPNGNESAIADTTVFGQSFLDVQDVSNLPFSTSPTVVDRSPTLDKAKHEDGRIVDLCVRRQGAIGNYNTTSKRSSSCSC